MGEQTSIKRNTELERLTMSIEKLFSKRRQIRAAWDQNKVPNKEMIYDLLKRTQKIAPSKQNLYPFKIHAFGPHNHIEKEKVAQICKLYKTGSVNDWDLDKENAANRGQNNDYKNAPWVLVFELRMCKANTFVKDYSETHQDWGRFTQVDEKRFRETANVKLSCIEVGMFTKILAGLCLENNLAISYIRSFPEWTWKGQKQEYSKNKNKHGLDWDALPEITEVPLFVVQLGYKADIEDPLASNVCGDKKGGDLLEDKPSIDEIVQFKD